ncbi:hypothetical protein [Paenibacillus sp. FSL R5-0473]|uniref:hypothetical protein n=1 Tax=Paenibacillus sp. FSL R5-0473 TaxID=2921642 RepID=UPI0030FCF6B2
MKGRTGALLSHLPSTKNGQRKSDVCPTNHFSQESFDRPSNNIRLRHNHLDKEVEQVILKINSWKMAYF